MLNRRKRDPEARRRAIVEAAAELIVEVGVDAVTHRMIAARADVPLGATTQYFKTLDDLRGAALQQLADQMNAQISALRVELSARGTTPAVLTEIITAALRDARTMQVDRAVVTAAVHDPQLRAMGASVFAQLVTLLEPEYGADRALAASIFINGILFRTQIDDDPPAPHIIESALAGILGVPTP
jgi:DNA-binding transcriptional regulator YbjK